MERPVRLIGEMLIGHESSAAHAISWVLNQLNHSSRQYEEFFSEFDLNIHDWKATGVDHTELGFFISIEAIGSANKEAEKLEDFIRNNEKELYFEVNGFVPTAVVTPINEQVLVAV